jgi:DNA-binding transcriptional ArsR family regulator
VSRGGGTKNQARRPAYPLVLLAAVSRVLTTGPVGTILYQMVNYSGNLSRAFSALGDPTRRQILERVARGDVSVSRLAESRGVTTAAILKHLRVLEQAGLVETQKVGRVRKCTISPRPLRQMAEWIESYESLWEARLDRLARHLQQSGGKRP